LDGWATATASRSARAVPDLCEMTRAANACAMLPDRPDLHCPIARIDKVATIPCETSEGGILSRAGLVEAGAKLAMMTRSFSPKRLSDAQVSALIARFDVDW